MGVRSGEGEGVPERRTIPVSVTDDIVRNAHDKVPIRPEVAEILERLGELPLPPRPSMFQPDPKVIGSPEFARLVWDYMNQSPRAKSATSTVSTGPTTSVMEGLLKAQLDPSDFDQLNVIGQWDAGRKNIFVAPQRPGRGNDEVEGTLAHEMSHAVGFGENTAYKVSDRVAEIRNPKKYQSQVKRRTLSK